jgi:hypothetical protein
MDLEKFGEELETRAMAVERERTAPQFYSQKMFELMRGNGNQSGINDPQVSNSNG